MIQQDGVPANAVARVYRHRITGLVLSTTSDGRG